MNLTREQVFTNNVRARVLASEAWGYLIGREGRVTTVTTYEGEDVVGFKPDKHTYEVFLRDGEFEVTSINGMSP